MSFNLTLVSLGFCLGKRRVIIVSVEGRCLHVPQFQVEKTDLSVVDKTPEMRIGPVSFEVLSSFFLSVCTSAFQGAVIKCTLVRIKT